MYMHSKSAKSKLKRDIDRLKNEINALKNKNKELTYNLSNLVNTIDTEIF